MKKFGISAALGLAMALLPAGARAHDGEAPVMPPVPTPIEAPTMADEAAPPVEEDEPTLDLVFCLDVSGSMAEYQPILKPTILSIVRQAVRQNPGRKLRLGLVRYGDADRRYLVLDLSEDQTKFMNDLLHDQFLGAFEYVGDVIKKSVEQMKWSKNSVRRLYVFGNESAEQGPTSLNAALLAAREKSVTISTTYCALHRPRPDASDVVNVRSWFGSDWNIKAKWIELARLGGGDYIQVVSRNGSVAPGTQPLLAVGWDGQTATRFADYIHLASIKEKMLQMRDQKAFQSAGNVSMARPGRATHLVAGTSVEHSVMRYYQLSPEAASYLLRPW